MKKQNCCDTELVTENGAKSIDDLNGVISRVHEAQKIFADYSQEQVDKIDISYNYNYFVLPLLRLYLF